MKKYLKYSLNFIKKPVSYAENINQIENVFFVFIIALYIFIRFSFDLFSPHDFPPELSFEKVGIVSPEYWEFLISYILTFFISFSVFSTTFMININHSTNFLKFLTINFLLFSLFLYPLLTKSFFLLFTIIIPFILFFIIRKAMDDLISFMKIFITLYIIGIIFEPLLFIAEYFKIETLFMVIYLIFSLTTIIYYIKLIKTKFDLSINKLLFYSLVSYFFSFLYGLLLHKANIFTSNITKLLIY